MEKCIVCGATCTTYNSQQLPVCKEHANYEILDLRCPYCKSYLDVRKGKYGSFFTCISCGTITVHKLKSFGNVFFGKKSK